MKNELMTRRVRKIHHTLPTTWGVVAERRWLLDTPHTIQDIADDLDIDYEDVAEIDRRVIRIALGEETSPLTGLL